MLEFTKLAERLVGADLVITGEGSLDTQSLLGKTPIGVARAAGLAGVPVIAVSGRSALSDGQRAAAGFRAVHALTELESNVDTCIGEAGRLLEDLGKRIGRQLADGADASAAAGHTKETMHV